MKNVILICTDQWRADCLSVTGHPHVQTPFLDELASQGTICDRAYSPSPTCVPARMSLLTGQSPQTHRRVGYRDGVEFDFDTTIASAFHESGFQTQAIGKMHVAPERHRAGFDNVILHDGYLHNSRFKRRDVRFYDDYTTWLGQQNGVAAGYDEYENGVHCNAVVSRPWDAPEYQHPTNWCTSQAIDWLYRRDPLQPFFLFLSYHRPHAPYNPPRWAWEYYSDQDMYEPELGNWEQDYLGEFRNDNSPQSHVAQYSEQVANRALAGYYGNISHIDLQLKRLFEALVDFGLDEDTIVCFTSDHGDMMGQHGMWRKGYPYEGSARVPMIFQGPGIRRGRTNELMDLTDLMPTLLDLAGAEVPAGLDGRSVAGALRMAGTEETSTTPAHQVLHGEHYIFGQTIQWIITSQYKYIWWSRDGREQLFDMVTDPGELNDLLISAGGDERKLSDEQQLSSRSCRAELTERLRGRPEGFVRDSMLVPGRPCSEIIPA